LPAPRASVRGESAKNLLHLKRCSPCRKLLWFYLRRPAWFPRQRRRQSPPSRPILWDPDHGGRSWFSLQLEILFILPIR